MRWVLASVQGLSPVAERGGHSSSRCAGLSLSRPLPLRSTGSRGAGPAVVAHGPSRSSACEIFPDRGTNPRSLHWQADSQPLRHQGSPQIFLHLLYTLTISKDICNFYQFPWGTDPQRPSAPHAAYCKMNSLSSNTCVYTFIFV